MKILCVSVFACLLAATPFVSAQPTASSAAVTTSPGQGKAVQTMKATATVVAIDPATRTVSLRRPDGQIVDIQAGPEVRNFDKIKVGDTVTVEYTVAFSLELKKGGVGASKHAESEEMTRAPVGGQPGATVGRKVTILADVVVVNSKDKMITLRGPRGHMVDLKVEDPDQLKRVKPGDQVEAVYTEALAVAVVPGAK
jgi:Cu/Ag efflux protein CusF